MAKKSNGLAVSAGLYGISNVIYGLISILFIPILTRYLTRADYGIVANFEVLVAFVTPLVGAGLSAAIMRQYYEQESVDLPTYITNSLYIMVVTFSLVGVVVLFSADLINQVSKFPAQLMWIIVVIAFSQTVVNILLALWRAEKKPLYFGIFRILQSAVNVGITIYLVVGLKWSWLGRVYGIFWTFVIFGFLALVMLAFKGYIKFKFNKGYVLHALRYGLPLIPHSVSGVVRTMTDRLFITAMVGVDANGLYSVGYQVGKVIGFIENTFNMAWLPWFYEHLKKDDPEVKRKIVKYSYLYMVSIGAFALLFSVLAPLIMKVFVGKDFQGATVYVIWIAMGYAFNGMYKMVCNYFFYLGNTHVLSIITTITALANVGLNYIMIKSFGSIGAAQATTLTLLLGFVMTWIMAARVYKMPWSLRRETNNEKELDS